MPETHAPPLVIHFGPFEADLHAQELRKLGVRLRLPRQSFQILQMLLEHPGELVTREDMRATLWPSDTFVDFEHGLNAAVNRLREALGDAADTTPATSKRSPAAATASSPPSRRQLLFTWLSARRMRRKKPHKKLSRRSRHESSGRLCSGRLDVDLP